jgi:hypothetical protein
VAHRINHRIHTRTLTVDDRITVTGGRTIGGEQWAATTDNRATLTDQGALERVSLEDGRELGLDKEPDATVWKRWSRGSLSIIVPESQLEPTRFYSPSRHPC